MKRLRSLLLILTVVVSVGCGGYFIISNVVYNGSDKPVGNVSHEGQGGSKLRNVPYKITTPDFVSMWNKLSNSVKEFSDKAGEEARKLSGKITEEKDVTEQPQEESGDISETETSDDIESLPTDEELKEGLSPDEESESLELPQNSLGEE